MTIMYVCIFLLEILVAPCRRHSTGARWISRTKNEQCILYARAVDVSAARPTRKRYFSYGDDIRYVIYKAIRL